ncbi:hypothetical protein EE612_050428 [Oryza sativa]|nr:hypothetical protein EE612_050428 [Oryza sativa]
MLHGHPQKAALPAALSPALYRNPSDVGGLAPSSAPCCAFHQTHSTSHGRRKTADGMPWRIREAAPLTWASPLCSRRPHPRHRSRHIRAPRRDPAAARGGDRETGAAAAAAAAD